MRRALLPVGGGGMPPLVLGLMLAAQGLAPRGASAQGYVAIGDRGLECRSTLSCSDGACPDGGECTESLFPVDLCVAYGEGHEPTDRMCGCDAEESEFGCPPSELGGDEGECVATAKLDFSVCVYDDGKPLCMNRADEARLTPCYRSPSGELVNSWEEGDCDDDGVDNRSDECPCMPCGSRVECESGCRVRDETDGGTGDAGARRDAEPPLDAAAHSDAASGEEPSGMDARPAGEPRASSSAFRGGGGCNAAASRPPTPVGGLLLVAAAGLLRRRMRRG